MNKKFEEKSISRETIFEGKIISLHVDQVLLPDGKKATREIVTHSGAVAVIALIDDHMILVEQYRKAMERSMVEIPAGKLDPGEKPIDAVARELQEETGYTCDHIRPVCSFYTSPGFADEIIHLFIAEDLIKGEMNPDEDEFLSCEKITLTQAQEYIKTGKIIDAKTIMAVYAWQLYKLTGNPIET